MRVFRAVFNFLLFSHIFLGCSVTVFAAGYCRILGNSISTSEALLIFAVTTTCYSFLRKKGNYPDERYALWKQQHPLLLFLSMWIGAITAIAALAIMQDRNYPVLATVTALSIAYQWGLRKIGWLKPLVVALVCSLFFVALPNQHRTQLPIWELTVLPFFFLFSNLLLFEIKDIATDGASKLKTWPHLIGIPFTKWMAVFSLMISAVLPFSDFRDANVPLFFAYSMPHLICIQSIWYGIHKKTDSYFYWLVAEGWMFLAGSYALFIKWMLT